jgi:hypothetical protein
MVEVSAATGIPFEALARLDPWVFATYVDVLAE